MLTTHVRCALPYKLLSKRTWHSAVLHGNWQVPDSVASKHLPTVLRTLKSFHPVKRRLSFVVLPYLLQVLLCHSLLCPLRSPWRRRMRRRKEVDNRRMCKENIIRRSVQSICWTIGKMLLIKRHCINILISKVNTHWAVPAIKFTQRALSCPASRDVLQQTAQPAWHHNWSYVNIYRTARKRGREVMLVMRCTIYAFRLTLFGWASQWRWDGLSVWNALEEEIF